MSTFKQFRDAVEAAFSKMATQGNLLQSRIEKDTIWNTYLGAFPQGTNELYRERTGHDCVCCKQFIRNVGRVVSVVDGKLVSIWDHIQVGGNYQIVANALAKKVHEYTISGIYLNDSSLVGRKDTLELGKDGSPNIVWDHFYAHLPTKAYNLRGQVAQIKGEIMTNNKVLLRSIVEISDDAVETVSELIEQNLIHRGNSYAPIIKALKQLKADVLSKPDPELACWDHTIRMTKANHECNIRGTAIGTLLVDLSEGEDLNVAVKKYEDKVSGTNYMRTTALVTPKMVADAKAKVAELGLEDSFARRYAKKEDISVNDVLFADGTVKPFMEDSIFDVLKPTAATTVTHKLDKVREVTAADFVENILPKATSVEVLLENKHTNNMVSLIAPVSATAPCIMKWGNNFSWNYEGEVAESDTRARVKAAGGVVDAPLRFSLAWDNHDDLDFHVSGKDVHLYFANKSRAGMTLDVDMRGSKLNNVENIYCSDLKNLTPGEYELFVHNYHSTGKYNRRGEQSGFSVEVEYNGSTATFEYKENLRSNGRVTILKFKVDKQKNVTFSKPLVEQPKDIWGVKTGQYQKVNMVMKSPNMWANSNKSGNDHLFFMIDGCVNEADARGFYNEFLAESLLPHRKVFEMLSANMKAPFDKDQLSGVGFSSSLRNDVVVRVKGQAFTQVVKVVF